MATLTAQLSWLWPRLQVISCWAGHNAEPVLTRLRRAFPGVTIQPKGLLATEGVVSIPWGFSGKHVAAVRSHFLEFIEMESGRTMRLWELQRGQICSAVITTDGGLYRYRLHDLVRVADFCGRTPCLEFVGRDGLVSDLCGEKLTGEDVKSALAHFTQTTGVIFQFAMAVPDVNGKIPGYVLILETAGESTLPAGEAGSTIFEELLQRNFHYAHARRLGQLQPVRILSVRNAAATCRDALVSRGRRHGEIKFPVLFKEAGLADDFRMS